MELLKCKLTRSMLCPSEYLRSKISSIRQCCILVIGADTDQSYPLLQNQVLYSEVCFSLKSEKDCLKEVTLNLNLVSNSLK